MEYQFLKKAIENKGYVFFDNGSFNLNFIWVRNDLHATNHFTDDLHIAYKANGIEYVLSVKCTTKPGLKKSLYNPNTVEGVTGTAIVKCNQYRGAWKFIDSYEDFSKYPFFRQIKNIDYYRDGNRDNEIDLVQEQDNKLFGTHGHKMSNVGDKRKVEEFEVNNFSQGCMGAPVSEWDKVVELTRKAIISGQGTVFTFTIVDAVDLK